MTPREYELRKEGYERIQREKWELTRLHAVKIALLWIDKKDVGSFDPYKWFPSPYDPSPAERKKIMADQAAEQAEEVKKIYDERLKQAAQAGIKINTA
jgi:hypothetical protein